MEFLLPILLLLIIVPIAVVFALCEGKMTEHTWDTTAQRFGLERGPRSLEGTWRGIVVEARRENTTIGPQRVVTKTLVIARLTEQARLPSGLVVSKEDAPIRAEKRAGHIDDIELGIPDLDPLVVIVGDEPDAVRRWFAVPAHVRAVQDVALVAPTFRIDAEQVILVFGSVVRKERVLFDAIETAVRSARALSGLGDDSDEILHRSA